MTIDEFRRSVESYREIFQRAWNWAAVPGLFFFVVLNFAVAVGSPWVAAVLGTYAPFWLMGLCVAVGIGSSLAVYFPLMRDAPDLHCPHCKEHLAEVAAIVIASRNCPFCGSVVLERAEADPVIASAPSGGTAGGLPFEDYLQTTHDWTRRLLITLFSSMGATIVIGLAAVPLILWLESHGLLLFGDVSRAVYGSLVFGLALVAFFVPLLLAALFCPEIKCPHCQTDVLSGYVAMRVIASGHCPRCGGRILQEPERGADGPRWRNTLADQALIDACRESDDPPSLHRVGFFYGILGSVMVVGVAGSALFAFILANFAVNPYVAVLVFGITMTAIFVAGIVGLLRYGGRDDSTAPGPRCATCETPLREHADLIIATGNCGTCGHAVSVPSPPA